MMNIHQLPLSFSKTLVSFMNYLWCFGLLFFLVGMLFFHFFLFLSSFGMGLGVIFVIVLCFFPLQQKKYFIALFFSLILTITSYVAWSNRPSIQSVWGAPLHGFSATVLQDSQWDSLGEQYFPVHIFQACRQGIHYQFSYNGLIFTKKTKKILKFTQIKVEQAQGIHSYHNIIYLSPKALWQIHQGPLVKVRSSIWHYLDQLSNRLTPLGKSLYQSLFLGDRSYLSHYELLLFYQTGLIHLLALSGLHLQILFFIFLAFIQIFIRNRWSFLLVLFPLFLYIFCVGDKITLYRALVVYLIFYIQKFVNTKNSLEMLCISFFFLALIAPKEILTISGQLSYISIFGIFLFQKYWYQLLKKILIKPLAYPISVGLGAETLLYPFLLLYFHQMNIFSSLFTYFLDPFIFLVFLFSVFYCFLGWLGLLGSCFHYFFLFWKIGFHIFASIIFNLVEIFSNIKQFSITIDIMVYLGFILLLGLVIFNDYFQKKPKEYI